MDSNIKRKHNWWKRRTFLEKCLVLAITVIILTIIGLLLKLFIPFPIEKLPKNVCMTQKCVRIAAGFLEKIDNKVAPCDDFYKFACGNFIKHATIPDDDVIQTSNLEIELKTKLRTLLEEPVNTYELKHVKLMKTIYKSCMNTTRIELQGLSYIQKILKALGGWPVLEKDYWNENAFDWTKLSQLLTKAGFRRGFFFQIYTSVDDRNSSKRILTVSQGCMPLRTNGKTTSFNDTRVQASYDYMVKVATLLGADPSRAANELMEVMEFKMELARIMVPREQRKNFSREYNLMTIQELQRNVTKIPWLQLINNYLHPVESMRSDELINVALPQYLRDLEKLLSKTNKRVLANYMLWLVVSDNIQYLPEELRKLQNDFFKTAYDRSSDSPRWKKCVEATYRIKLGLSSLYVKRFFRKSAKNKVAELVSDIRDAFLENLKKVGWMDRKTKKHALLKAEKMTTMIGYPDKILDDEKVEAVYEDLELNPNEHYLNINLNLSLFMYNYRNKQLRKPVIKEDWRTHTHSYIPDVFYDDLSNRIELQAGILQEPYFDESQFQYLNYGAIGYLIGHEITHGFDDGGRQYDKDGNLVDWWEPETNRTFANKAQCFVEQYGNYTVPEIEINLNGVRTLGLNIADNGGIKNAYRGYLKWMQRNPPEPMLPGLPYTPQQMFWVSAASSWCTKYKKSYLKSLVEKGSLCPSYFRVVVPFMNSDYFAKDFNCPLGTAMNPKYKCRVW